MFNASDFVSKGKHCNGSKLDTGIHNAIGFGRPIMMDSGGFSFLRRGSLGIRAAAIASVYNVVKPDYGMVLDRPLFPSANRRTERAWQDVTLRNTREMNNLVSRKATKLVPVVHGSTPPSIDRFLTELDQIGEFDVLAVGSIVPALFNVRAGPNLDKVLHALIHLRASRPRVHLHALGVGSMKSMHMMFLLGIDSVDSSSWRTKAAYGAIQIPGCGDRYVTDHKRHFKARAISAEERRVLDRCKCPICINGEVGELKRSFTGRALHNAWVLQKEAAHARTLKRQGKYIDFARGVLQFGKYGPALRRSGLL
jgi:7-cyano-7-deazaguanine tRNA-ribosyltransferase